MGTFETSFDGMALSRETIDPPRSIRAVATGIVRPQPTITKYLNRLGTKRAAVHGKRRSGKVKLDPFADKADPGG